MKLIWFVILFQVSVALAITQDEHLKEFIGNVELLVLKTTEQALLVTTNVYENLTKTMSPLLKEATEPIIKEYLQMVQQSMKCKSNYTEKRKLLRYFRYNNRQIERLRMQMEPLQPKFEFHLISNDFYSNGKNTTEFDNLYLDFMQQFQKASQKLWDALSEDVVEEQQELLELLDEISKEKELSERDKLYDEFIETFLFKSDIDEMENRELE